MPETIPLRYNMNKVNLDLDYLLATISSLHFTIAQLRAELQESREQSRTDAEVERAPRKPRSAPANSST